MSLLKILKGWREVLRLPFIRKGPPRVHVAKPVQGRYYEHQHQQHNVTPKFKSSFLRSVFSRYAGHLSRHTLRSLRPKYNSVNRMRHVPFLSLIGISLGMDMDVIADTYMENTLSAVRNVLKDYKWEPELLASKPENLDDLDINKTSVIGNGCEGAVFEAKLKNEVDEQDLVTGDADTKEQDYNLAVKAVFNYGAESNASSILRELNREIVPLQLCDGEPNEIDELIKTNVPRLPPHPNVVDMHGIFIDDMLVTEQGRREFPAAMPRRVNPDGCFGRNKTLYLVMRKCTTKLSDFLSSDLPMRTRCLLLAQLLHAVHHINSHGVAHRDIKADNILIDVPKSGGTPQLQVCDFGCCLAEQNKNLVMPFVSNDINLGGNSWLMAPEIACARPGEGNVLDFRQSDLWACGALAYQILGVDNPFYPNGLKQLKSQSYSEDELPPLPDETPMAIKRLVKSLLSRDPTKRPLPSVAALVVLMVIWESSVTRHSQSNRRRPHRVVVTKRNSRTVRYVRHFNKERQKMGLVLGQMFELIRKMVSATESPAKQDMIEISNFMCLSKLTQADFAMALKFFH